MKYSITAGSFFQEKFEGGLFMGRIVNTFQLIEQAKGNINSRYDLCLKNAVDIEKASANSYEMIANGFRFGYMQGLKAAQAKRRKQA